MDKIMDKILYQIIYHAIESCGYRSYPFDSLIVLVWYVSWWVEKNCKHQLHVHTLAQLSVQAFFSEQAPWLLYSDVLTTFFRHIPPDLTTRFDKRQECTVQSKARNSPHPNTTSTLWQGSKKKTWYFRHWIFPDRNSQKANMQSKGECQRTPVSNAIYRGVRNCSGPNSNPWVIQSWFTRVILSSAISFHMCNSHQFACLAKKFSSNSWQTLCWFTV